MQRKSTLEADLRALMEEFVARIVTTLRGASFADVASLSMPSMPAALEPARGRNATGAARRAGRTGTQEVPDRVEPSAPRAPRGGGAARDAEIARRVLETLSNAPSPMNARALGSALGVPVDRLAAPLKMLRAEGRIKKHGDKRATTYGV